MNARDLMSHDIVKVAPDTPLRDVAKVLLDHQMTAVPVVDSTGSVVGMVSEGDLIGRKKTERETSNERWLMRLAEGEQLNGEFLAHIQGPLAVAREVMSSPVISVSEETRFDEIASLMATHRVKRVPVVRDGQIVGIVRRADLLRSIGDGPSAPIPHPRESARVSAQTLPPGDPSPNATPAPVPGAAETLHDDELKVGDFRRIVEHHKAQIDLERAHRRQAAAELGRRDVRRMIETHISDSGWRGLVHQAREAAERGETEFLLLRFPSRLCSDEARAINAPDRDWPTTLRGEAAEMYLRWERELRPRGFHLAARVIDFPDGVPGDVGLYLVWGE
jgi:CBS domain-containing protein